MNQKNIGKNLKNIRRQCGLTQAEVAEQTGVTTAHISHTEIGCGAISLPLLLEVCKLMKVTPNDILAGEYTPEGVGDSTVHEVEIYNKKTSYSKINPEDRLLLDALYEFMKKRKRVDTTNKK